ncbi:MAG: hypothetical protein VKK04_26690 [Synechococcales bacterium]|nr:hypothetical protein [Synechococcales bacterium]
MPSRIYVRWVNHPDTQGVTVMVAHFVNISAIAGSGIASGEMVVMQVKLGVDQSD